MFSAEKFVDTLNKLTKEDIDQAKDFYNFVENFFEGEETLKLFTEEQIKRIEPLLSVKDDILTIAISLKYFGKEI